MNITKGKIAKAQKVVIYGVEGIGKSTLAAQLPDPLFIDTEGSTSNMDVARMDKPSSYTMLTNQINYIKANPQVCKTLVIDTIDWAERLATEFICANGNKRDITQFGYGEGFIQLENEIGRLLNSLSDLIEKGINVVLTAHAIIRKFEQPDEMGAYDRYELKLGNKTTAKTAALIKEWADLILFCNYKTHVIATDDKGTKHKAQGGQRVMYAEHHPAWDAKNRHGLPFEMPMDYAQIAHIFSPVAPTQPAPAPTPEPAVTPQIEPAQIPTPETQASPIQTVPFDNDAPPISPTIATEVRDLMLLHNVTQSELFNAMTAMGHFPADTPPENIPAEYWPMLVAHWQSVLTHITKARN